MTDERNGSVVEELRRVKSRGFRLLVFSASENRGKGPTARGWTERNDEPEAWVEGMNAGVFSGVRFPGERDEFLADVDFDDPSVERLLVGLNRRSARILPDTDWGFTRDGRTITHAFYATDTPVVYKEYTCSVRKKNLLELRGTKVDGSIGLQTVIPPSTTENGARRWLNTKSDGLPAGRPAYTSGADLARRCTLLVIAADLVHFLGVRAFNHDVRMASAAWLLNHGLSTDEVVLVGENIAEALSNDPDGDDVRRTVESTAQRIADGRSVTQKPFTDALGEHAKTILRDIQGWLGVARAKKSGGQADIERALTALGVTLHYDAFALRFYVTRHGEESSLDDAAMDSLWLEMERSFGILPREEYFRKVLFEFARRDTRHPVRDYLDSLEWDRVPRVDTWLIVAAKAADNEYVRAVSALPLIAAVRRVRRAAQRKPRSTKFDEMTVLESATQGFLKSSLLRALCKNDDWFTDDFSLHVESKQLIEQTSGKWIIEASDLQGMRATDVTKLKSMLSRQIDGPVRLAYARTPVEISRQFVLFGTTNAINYLKDQTGNRRFWPVEVQRCDVEWMVANRDQLWAEAAHREASGESIRLDPALYEIAKLQQERRQLPNAFREKLAEVFWLPYYRLSPDEVWEHLCIPLERRNAAMPGLLDAMQAIGFRYDVTVKKNGVPLKGWAKGTKADKARAARMLKEWEKTRPPEPDALRGEVPLLERLDDEEEPVGVER